MMFIRTILGIRDIKIENQIRDEKSRLNNNRQALQSGAALLATMSNALNIMANEEERTNATHNK